MKIIVTGYGPVGQAVRSVLLSGGHQVIVDDPYPKYGRRYITVPADLENVDGVVVCVSTPQREDGSCETQNVRDVLRKYGKTKFLIKSAVDPVWLSQHHDEFGGSVTVSPEFLGSSNQFRDPAEEFINQTFAIYGGPDARWWDELFRRSLPKLTDVKYSSRDQAAFGKYLESSFLAMRVSFFNEMADIFWSMGFEGYDQMIDAITVDPRIGRSHSMVPGPDGKCGWGGHCLPKDVNALRHASPVDTPFLDAMVEVNKRHRDED